MQEIHSVRGFGKGTHYRTVYRLDAAARLISQEEYYLGQAQFSYSWTYSNDSLLRSATLTFFEKDKRDSSEWQFDSLGRTSNIVFFDRFGKVGAVVHLSYDDCLATAHTEYFSAEAPYGKTEETMDCRGNFRKTAITTTGEILFVNREVLRDEVEIRFYLVFPPELPPLRHVKSRKRFIGGGTLEKTYLVSMGKSRKLLVGKDVKNDAGQWVKRKSGMQGTGNMVRVRYRYNDAGLPVKIVARFHTAPRRHLQKITVRFTYKISDQ